MEWIKKCYWPDTLEGTLLLNGIINLLNRVPVEFYWYVFPIRFVVELLDIGGIVTNVAEGGYAFEVFYSRVDYYNPFFVLGKTIKLAIQIYMKRNFI